MSTILRPSVRLVSMDEAYPPAKAEEQHSRGRVQVVIRVAGEFCFAAGAAEIVFGIAELVLVLGCRVVSSRAFAGRKEHSLP